MSSKIPIFPLNLVMFPKSRYPLHIFEERYKKMINRCISENAGFGIVAKIDNEIAQIGSYVIISKVIKKYDNDEMDIIVISVGRFMIRELTLNPDGYNIADIDEYNDNPDKINESLQKEMQNKFENIVDKVNFELDENFWNNYFSASSKAFKLAEKSGLSLKQQQELLMLRNENERINFLIEHFEQLDKKISENLILRDIIMNDGYLNDREWKIN